MNLVVYIVVFLLASIYLSCRYMLVQYDFYKPLEDKTVIMAWTHKCVGIQDGDWGLGDIIKATYAMYELSKRMNFKLIVDISQHNVSNFLVQRPHPHQKFVQDNKDNIPYHNIVFEELEKHIRIQLMDKDVIMLFCSGFIEPFANNPNPHTISEDAKKYIQTILTPTQAFQKIIDQKRSEIPFPYYTILHYRLGDVFAFKCPYCVKGKIEENDYPKAFEELSSHIEQHRTGKDVLLSDSDEFRRHVAKKWGKDIFVYTHPITHLRYQQKLEETKNTLIEFFVMTRAHKIHSYTVYKWISGFVLVANKVFDVPLTWDKDDN
jgi:hypothetical protein